MKIIAIVKFNEGEAYVLDKKPQLIYTKYGNDTIIGTDGMFLISFLYEQPTSVWKAFAGRKFDIHLSTGEIEHCYGQWWDGITKKAIEIINDEIIDVTACSLDELRGCYVFTGYKAIKSKIEMLRKEYSGRIYGYWEYNKILKNIPVKHGDRIDFRKVKNHKRHNRKVLL